MAAADALAVVTTLPTREQALALGRTLVEQRLVACAQVSAIDSVYRWNGGLCQEAEFQLVCKTTAGQWTLVEQAILAQHPYQLPAIHALPVARIHAPYGDWVASQVIPKP